MMESFTEREHLVKTSPLLNPDITLRLPGQVWLSTLDRWFDFTEVLPENFYLFLNILKFIKKYGLFFSYNHLILTVLCNITEIDLLKTNSYLSYRNKTNEETEEQRDVTEFT